MSPLEGSINDEHYTIYDRVTCTPDQTKGDTPSYILTNLRTHTNEKSGEISFCGDGPEGSTCFCLDGKAEDGTPTPCLLDGFMSKNQ